MQRFKVTVSAAEGDKAGHGEQREALACQSAEAALSCAPDQQAALSCGPDIQGLVAADREPGTPQALSPLTDK
jgi:hypothetical protein